MTYPNWFEATFAKENFERNLLPLADMDIKCLQIGAYTGDATKWMVDNILKKPDSFLVDVDTWEGSKEPAHENMDWKNVYKTYIDKNAAAISEEKVVVMQMTSDKYFANISNKNIFDFIYIDGDHTAFGVLRDGSNAYEKLKIGGMVAFDDYLWNSGMGNFNEPKYAIDALCHLLIGRVEKIEDNGQIWLKKII
jgi:predicted O-methyltransferase YrrM